MERLRGLAREQLPFAWRVAWARCQRHLLDAARGARGATTRADLRAFPVRLAHARSPLNRRPGAIPPQLQAGKEANVGLAAGLIHATVIGPGQLFSYHALVGRPTGQRGFRLGPELHDGHLTAGIGGGCCQVSNMIYWLAINAGMTIVERHRHGLDLFPDHERTVPFGCGATVFYNYLDLRFVNPLPLPIAITLHVDGGALEGTLVAPRDPGPRHEIVETNHRFFMRQGHRFRENTIRRQVRNARGVLRRDELVAHNLGRVCYDFPPS